MVATVRGKSATNPEEVRTQSQNWHFVDTPKTIYRYCCEFHYLNLRCSELALAWL